MSTVFRVHAELTQDRAPQSLADLLIAVAWKGRLLAVQVDLRVLRPFDKLRTKSRQLPAADDFIATSRYDSNGDRARSRDLIRPGIRL
jgi:hypothetical protein